MNLTTKVRKNNNVMFAEEMRKKDRCTVRKKKTRGIV
jgi:hypothetical protein